MGTLDAYQQHGMVEGEIYNSVDSLRHGYPATSLTVMFTENFLLCCNVPNVHEHHDDLH